MKAKKIHYGAPRLPITRSSPSIVHCSLSAEWKDVEVAVDWARGGAFGKMLNDPESMFFDRFSIRRAICADEL